MPQCISLAPPTASSDCYYDIINLHDNTIVVPIYYRNYTLGPNTPTFGPCDHAHDMGTEFTLPCVVTSGLHVSP